MTFEAIGLWGCERNGYMDLWNCLRTNAYVTSIKPKGDKFCCPIPEATITDYLPPPVAIVDGWVDYEQYTNPPYVDPATDLTWWYDAYRPESKNFFGLEVHKVSGLYVNTVTRDMNLVNSGCRTHIVRGPLVDKGYTITVEGALHGLTCCSVRFGYLALKQRMRYCCAQCTTDACAGTRLMMIPCLAASTFNDNEAESCSSTFTPGDELDGAWSGGPYEWRTYMNVTVLEEIEIVGTSGPSCGSCGCGTTTFVRFVLRTDPGQWLWPIPFFSDPIVIDEGLINVTACDTDPDSCVTDDPLADPDCSSVVLPAPIDASFEGCYCTPMVITRNAQPVAITGTSFPTFLEVTIETGAEPLRNLRVTVIPFDDYSVLSDIDPCVVIGGFMINYLPANTTWRSRVDGVTAEIAGVTYDANRTLLNLSGAPGSPCILLPTENLMIIADADAEFIADDATIIYYYRQVEP